MRERLRQGNASGSRGLAPYHGLSDSASIKAAVHAQAQDGELAGLRAVRGDEDRPSRQGGYVGQDIGLGLSVERARDLVEHHNGRAGAHGARDGQALELPLGEIAILLRVSRNAVYEWSLLEDDPLPLKRMMGRKRGRFAFRDELLEWSKRHAT